MGINRVKTCYNCGAILQCDNKELPGYCNRDVFENERQNFIFCDKCFNQEKYQNAPNEPTLSQDIINVIKDAKKRRCLFVYVVSLYSFECSFSKQISQLLVGCNVIAVGNKRDLLPKEVSDEHILDYVRHRFSVAGIKLKGAFVTSDTEIDKIHQLGHIIDKFRRGKDVIIIGAKSSGKKTLMLNFLRSYRNFSNTNIITDKYPNSNIESLIIPIYDEAKIYVTPGYKLDNSYEANIDSTLRKQIIVKKTVNKKETTILKGQSLMIGGLAMIELVNGPKTNLELYFANCVEYIKRPSSVGLNKFIKKIHLGLLKPINKNINNQKDLDVYEINVSEINKRDIGIQGLGWFSFEGNEQIFRIYVPHNVAIYKSRAKI